MIRYKIVDDQLFESIGEVKTFLDDQGEQGWIFVNVAVQRVSNADDRTKHFVVRAADGEALIAYQP